MVGTAVVSLDMEGRITTINRAARRLLALDPTRDPVGKEFAALLSEEARRAIEPLVAKVTEEGVLDTAREADVLVGGRTLNLALSATALRGDRGETLGSILVIEDLTGEAGVLEIADILIVNKADLPQASHTARELRAMQELRSGAAAEIEVIETIATTHSGVDKMSAAIDRCLALKRSPT